MNSPLLQEIEAKLDQLSAGEKRQLLDRLKADARLEGRAAFVASLPAMAADPEIQRELKFIQDEFAETEEDGLESI